MRDRLEESPVMALQETVSVPDSVGTERQQKERRLSSVEMVSPAPSTSALLATSTLPLGVGLGQAVLALASICKISGCAEVNMRRYSLLGSSQESTSLHTIFEGASFQER